MNKITIVNAHWSNRGDEAALRPIINSILKYDPNITITVIFKDRKEVQQFPYSGRVQHFSAQYLPENLDEILDAVKAKRIINGNIMRMINNLQQTDLIIYSPGGAVLSDKFWWRKQIEYFIPFMCAREYKVPIIVAAPSMGPFDDDDEKNYWRKKWLSVAKKICIREPISTEYLKKFELNNVITTIDTAFYDEIIEKDFVSLWHVEKELSNFFRRYREIVAVTLSDFSWHVEYMKNKELLENQKIIIRDFLKKINMEGKGILFIPQLFGNQNDIDYLMQFMGEGRYILSNKLDTYYQQYVVSKCYAVIGMRYHSNIFAAKMGIPFISIGYEEKMYGFMQEWQFDDFLIRLNELNEEDLIRKWEFLKLNYNEYKNNLLCKREIWKKRATITIDSILKEIK